MDTPNETPVVRKVVREVVMDIKASKDDVARRITVEFDLSDLTEDQIADWAVSANGIRVWYQNRERPKGDTHLVALSKVKQTVKVVPCGTRVASVRTMTPEEMIEYYAKNPDKLAEFMEQMKAIKKGEGIEA